MSINSEDFEREFEKDSVYLLEKRLLEEEQFWRWYEAVHRKSAQITVINESKITQDEHEQSNVLPF
jgi:hypothetical protein